MSGDSKNHSPYPTAKLYRCPICKNILTQEEWEADFKIGGNGMCPCTFADGHRVYIEYDVYHLSPTTARMSKGDEEWTGVETPIGSKRVHAPDKDSRSSKPR